MPSMCFAVSLFKGWRAARLAGRLVADLACSMHPSCARCRASVRYRGKLRGYATRGYVTVDNRCGFRLAHPYTATVDRTKCVEFAHSGQEASVLAGAGRRSTAATFTSEAPLIQSKSQDSTSRMLIERRHRNESKAVLALSSYPRTQTRVQSAMSHFARIAHFG